MRISVVIPSYNRAWSLPRALDSVLAQRRQADEVIVVNDGSTDDTADMLVQRYAQVRVIHQNKRGVSAARNAGIQAASHPWIALLDSDDAWDDMKLLQQCAWLEANPEFLWVHCDETWIRNGLPLAQRRYHQKRGGDIFFDCLPRCVISPSAVLFHRDLLRQHNGFDEQLPACEDYDLWLRLCVHNEVGFVSQALVVKYGGHDDQLSRTTKVLDQYRIKALIKLLDHAPLSNAQREATIAMLRQKIDIVAQGAQKRGQADVVAALAQVRQRLKVS